MGSQIGEFNDGNFLINLAINFHTVVVFVTHFKTSFKVVVATLCIPKGQIISECPYEIIVWTKIPTKKFN